MDNQQKYVCGLTWSVTLQYFQFEKIGMLYIVTHGINKCKTSELYYFATAAEKAFRKWIIMYASADTEKITAH